MPKVLRPILSVGEMMQQNAGVKFDKQEGALNINDKTIPLVRHRNLFYLSVNLKEEAFEPSSFEFADVKIGNLGGTSQNGEGWAKAGENIFSKGEKKKLKEMFAEWTHEEKPVVVEWCCGGASKLSQAAKEVGCKAIRLGLITRS